MTINWQTLVEQQLHTAQTGKPADTASFTALSQLGVIQVRGHDASSFLQNLFTNDINQLSVNQCQLSGLCNPKGRLLALFYVIRRENDYLLMLPATMCDNLIARLTLYILRSDVQLSNKSETYHVLGLLNSQDITAIKTAIPYHKHRFILISPLAEINEQIALLSAQNWQPRSENIWEEQDIQEGLPMVYPQSEAQFTPQQVNLDLVGGVSFQKGCYPGQEIVARLHYLGKPGRRMLIAKASLSSLPEIGGEVKNKAGDIAGHIVRYVQCEEHYFSLLISLRLSELKSELFIEKTPISIITIPFSTEHQESTD